MVHKNIIDQLAKAWLLEAKRLRSIGVCACGECDGEIIETQVRFKSGHDAKLLARYRREIAAILSA